MPAFIKTPKDEEKWQAIKRSVAKQRGKKIDDFTDKDWATVNAAWHKSEVEDIKKSMLSMPSTKVPNPGKMPKPKSMPKATDKPSIFFKTENEQFLDVKHPTLCKLRDFLQKKHRQ